MVVLIDQVSWRDFSKFFEQFGIRMTNISTKNSDMGFEAEFIGNTISVSWDESKFLEIKSSSKNVIEKLAKALGTFSDRLPVSKKGDEFILEADLDLLDSKASHYKI